MSTSAILLAAGLSRRMGKDKLLLEYDGKTFLQRAVDLMAELPVYERILVTTEARIGSINIPDGIQVLFNPSPEDGLNSSIRIGVTAATGTHYMFLTADQPKLTAGDLLPLLEAAKANPVKIVSPMVDSKPCSPTIFPEKYRLDLLSLTGDNGGRTIRDKMGTVLLTINVEKFNKYCRENRPQSAVAPSNFTDIDNEEDLYNL